MTSVRPARLAKVAAALLQASVVKAGLRVAAVGLAEKADRVEKADRAEIVAIAEIVAKGVRGATAATFHSISTSRS